MRWWQLSHSQACWQNYSKALFRWRQTEDFSPKSGDQISLQLGLQGTDAVSVRVWELDQVRWLREHGDLPYFRRVVRLQPHDKQVAGAPDPLQRVRRTVDLSTVLATAHGSSKRNQSINGHDTSCDAGNSLLKPQLTRHGWALRVFDEAGQPVPEAVAELGREEFLAMIVLFYYRIGSVMNVRMRSPT